MAELRLYTNVAFVSNIEFYSHRGFEGFGRGTLAAGGVVVHMKKMIELA